MGTEIGRVCFGRLEMEGPVARYIEVKWVVQIGHRPTVGRHCASFGLAAGGNKGGGWLVESVTGRAAALVATIKDNISPPCTPVSNYALCLPSFAVLGIAQNRLQLVDQ